MNRELPLILALDISGQPERWITYEDAAYYYAKGLVAWSLGQDENFTLFGGTSRMTGLQSTMDIDPIIAVRSKKGSGKHKHVHRVPLTNKALFRRDKNLCAYCGNEFPTSKLTRDHVHPRSRGGADKWENVVTSCGPCNKRKDAKTPAEAKMELLFVPYAPCKNEYLILMNRNILADQMEFLMASVPKHSRLHG